MADIKITNLKYKYPNTDKLALDNISIEIKKGEFIGVVGANGAGKSTFCQAILGIVPNFYKGSYGGEILIDDIVVKNTVVDDLCKTVGFVFQNPFNQVTGAKDSVFDEIAFGLENFGLSREEMHVRVEESMKLLEIEHLRDRPPLDLSGGQMQRMAIASVIAMKPEILILDEPTSQLDPQGSDSVFKAVLNLSKQNITIIMVEHKIEKIAEYSDKVLVLNEGKAVLFDTPTKVFSSADISEFGVNPPAFTRICKELQLKKNGFFPSTISDAKSLLI